MEGENTVADKACSCDGYWRIGSKEYMPVERFTNCKGTIAVGQEYFMEPQTDSGRSFTSCIECWEVIIKSKEYYDI